MKNRTRLEATALATITSLTKSADSRRTTDVTVAPRAFRMPISMRCSAAKAERIARCSGS